MHSFIYEFTYIYMEHCLWMMLSYGIDIGALFYHMSFILDTSMVNNYTLSGHVVLAAIDPSLLGTCWLTS